MDYILERMRQNLPNEKIMVNNGQFTIYDAQITRFHELARIRPTCARKIDTNGMRIAMPFEAEIRIAHVHAKMKYSIYVTELYGDYQANFSHIRMNGTLEADLVQESLTVTDFNITSSAVVDDEIVFAMIPKWILDWIRSYMDQDNTPMYEALARKILVKETNNFRHFDLLREMLLSVPQNRDIIELMEGRDGEEERLNPLNRI
ncbi:hypothetical protein RDWZM_009899 [Blomia tropicalis]|uniref:Uncharacterized protein n=1 Tax=Blomia tropicalis TaxID=40697 RepID=A0A9Q0LXQ3_BLOTA|nr:hypothetical protein RDWZM_009899 [Blomia tropicalis]